MDLDTFINAISCAIDEVLPAATGERRARQRGPEPTLADSEVLTMEVVGEYLGLPHDRALFTYYRHPYDHFFPGLCKLHRTTFVRRATNLWQVKERFWQHFAAPVPHDEQFASVDSFPLPVCLFARAYRCRRFRGSDAAMKPQVSLRMRPSSRRCGTRPIKCCNESRPSSRISRAARCRFLTAGHRCLHHRPPIVTRQRTRHAWYDITE